MTGPVVKVRPTGVPTKVPVQKSSPVDLFREVPPLPERKGFIRKCVGIIIQDTMDKLYRNRKRKREEYERICELAYGSGRKNGDET